jgi:tetratricopeptide (TPR) repeat protein
LISTRSRHIVIGAGVFALALVVRFAYLNDLAGLPFFTHPIMDASYHDAWARRIAGGALMGNEPFFRAPFYAYLLAAVYRLSDGSYLAPRVLQFILGSATSLMAYLLARRTMGMVAGIAAGILCAVYPVLIYFDGELLTEPVFTFFCVLGILLLDTARRRRGLRYWFLGGLTLGLALITRPTIGVFLVAALAAALALPHRRWAAATLLVAGVVIPVMPVTVHNYAVSGELIPLVWQGGLNLYLGNNPAADGWSATSPEIRKDWWGGYRDQIAIPREELGREPSYGEVSAYWRERAIRFMTGQPGRFAKLLLKKAALFWGSREFPNNQDFNFYRLQSRILSNPIGFGVVGPLALAGMLVLAGSWKRLYLLYAFVATYFVATVAFFVCSRYRVPVVPVLSVFAGGGIAYAVDSVKGRRWGRTVLLMAALAGAGLLVNLNPAGVAVPDLAQSLTQLGKVYLEAGDRAQAETQFREAIRVNPRWAEAYEQLGLMEMEAGPTEKAESYLRKAVEMMPEQAGAHRALAMLYLARGDLEQARRSILRAIEIAPGLEDSHNILGSIEREEGRTDAAVEAFEKELDIDPSNWRAYANLGSLFETKGDLARAEAAYLKALELHPGDSDLTVALAGIYSRQGREAEAAEMLKRASPEDSRAIDLRYNRAAMLQRNGEVDEARRIYEGILAEAPGHERTLINLGVIYASEGRDQKALELWQRALAVNPGNATAKRNIEILKARDESD